MQVATNFTTYFLLVSAVSSWQEEILETLLEFCPLTEAGKFYALEVLWTNRVNIFWPFDLNKFCY